MLFHIYVKLLSEIIRRSGLRCHQQADDRQVSFTISLDPKEAMETLNHYLEKVMGWMRKNKLRLNPDKREVLLEGPNSVLGSGCTSRLARVRGCNHVQSLCSQAGSAPGSRPAPRWPGGSRGVRFDTHQSRHPHWSFGEQ